MHVCGRKRRERDLDVDVIYHIKEENDVWPRFWSKYIHSGSFFGGGSKRDERMGKGEYMCESETPCDAK
jgi:hypothetical protein